MKRPSVKSALKRVQSSPALMRWPALSYGAMPVIFFVLIALASLAGYAFTASNLEGSRSIGVNRRLRENSIRIDKTLDDYADLLDGSTGFLQTMPPDEASWSKFISAYGITKNFSGMEALGVALGNTPQDAKVSYVEPKTELTEKAVGSPLMLTPALGTLLNKAATTGETQMSDTLPNIFSTKENVSQTHTGFLLAEPFYNTSLPVDTAEQKSQALAGYSIEMIRGDIFFATVFNGYDMSHTSIKAYLGEVKPENLQYQSDQTTDSDQRTVIQTIHKYNKSITLVYNFDTAYLLSSWINYIPQYILIGGLSIALIVAGVSGILLRSRYRRLVYQKEQDVNFAKDELLSLASHQLRTPATGVKQYIGMVLQGFAGELTTQQRTYLERAYSSNNRQLHVINDILHLAKLEAGRIVLAEHKFDIADMVREVVDEQREEARKGEVDLKLEAPPRGMIVGDSHMLRMVAENLVSNAIKYTPPKGKVTVRLTQRTKSWTLTIKDTGVGIADKDLNKLFKQFSRISNARSDFVTGTGIGLYLAHHLVVLHGGSIGVSSSEGKGSTFTVRLPRKT